MEKWVKIIIVVSVVMVVGTMIYTFGKIAEQEGLIKTAENERFAETLGTELFKEDMGLYLDTDDFAIHCDILITGCYFATLTVEEDTDEVIKDSISGIVTTYGAHYYDGIAPRAISVFIRDKQSTEIGMFTVNEGHFIYRTKDSPAIEDDCFDQVRGIGKYAS